MKNALSVLLILLHLSVFAQPATTAGRLSSTYLLSSVVIEGETNINGFTFSFENSKININPEQSKLIKELTHNEIVEFYIPVRAFRGSNSLMEEDFQSILKADTYPMVRVGIEKQKLNTIITENNDQNLNFFLTIAGVTKNIGGNYQISVCNKDEFILQGTTHVKLTDFGITPPKKMLGVLYVKDVIFIKFDIIISTLNI